MNCEQRSYIARIQESEPEEILIKKTGWEEIHLLRHAHPKQQIIYTLSGTLHVQIESTSYFIPEKHVAWIPACVEHEITSKSRQVSLVIYYIDADLSGKNAFSIYATNPVIAENLKYIGSKGPEIRHAETPALYDFVQSFFRLLPAMSPSSDILLKSLLIPNDSRLHGVFDYMTAHLQEDLRMEQVARDCGFSVRNLSRLFHASGIRFSDYMNHQRIMRAIELFTDGGRTLQQVAYEVGYSTPNHFNRVFKQVTGVSPRIFFSEK